MLDLPTSKAYRAGVQYTVRNVPKSVDERLRELARREGKSLNELALEALAAAVGLELPTTPRRDLSGVVGTWREDEETESALEDQRRVDAELWA
jgi:hypothetical protein